MLSGFAYKYLSAFAAVTGHTISIPLGDSSTWQTSFPMYSDTQPLYFMQRQQDGPDLPVIHSS